MKGIMREVVFDTAAFNQASEERDDLRASLADAGHDPGLSEDLGRLVSMTDRAAALEALL